jgi:hypothetical protein
MDFMGYMQRYQYGRIYKIQKINGDINDKIYIGSTRFPLKKRFSGHKSSYKRFINGKNKTKISVYDLFNEYGIENCEIVLIENYSCSNKNELELRERFHINNNSCVVNKAQPGINNKGSFKCSCGSRMENNESNRKRHEKTNKHQTYINNQTINNNQNQTINNTYNITINAP